MLGRSPQRLLTAAFRPAHYRAAVGIPFTVRHPFAFAARYTLGTGAYPSEIVVRTPLGPRTISVYSVHDVVTVTEVFCRQDYRVDWSAQTIVDLGSNIGVSATYFLTRNSTARVWCFEPAPQNVPRLREQLSQFGERVIIDESAVGPQDGEIGFWVEPTGRYGSAVQRADGNFERVSVQCRAIDSVVAEVLAQREFIDVLKLDIEGWETSAVKALAPELAARIGLILFEARLTSPLLGDLFEASYSEPVTRLVRKGG